MTTDNKAEAIGTGAAIIGAYAAAEITRKHGIPLEVASAAIGIIAALGHRLVRWIGRLMP